MGRSTFLAVVLTLLCGMALAEHAISLEPGSESERVEDPAVSSPSVSPSALQERSTPETQPPAPAPTAVTVVPSAPKVDVTFPSEVDIYMVPAATREVCTTRDWGYGEIETDCRFQPVPLRRENLALRGLCITRYGQRICY